MQLHKLKSIIVLWLPEKAVHTNLVFNFLSYYYFRLDKRQRSTGRNVALPQYFYMADSSLMGTGEVHKIQTEDDFRKGTGKSLNLISRKWTMPFWLNYSILLVSSMEYFWVDNDNDNRYKYDLFRAFYLQKMKNLGIE